jgi:hypothetical protein
MYILDMAKGVAIFAICFVIVFSQYAHGELRKLSDSFFTPEEDEIRSVKKAPACRENFFLNAGNRCQACSLCGPDLYVLTECSASKDTVCQWCLAVDAVKTDDFENKCTQALRTHEELALHAEEHMLDSSSSSESEEDVEEMEEKPAASRRYFIRIDAMAAPSCWKVIEPFLQGLMYLTIICLLVVIIRYVQKSRHTYRSITVHPPVFDDHDSKNIIRAADHIREKLGKKGYERLEEFI